LCVFIIGYNVGAAVCESDTLDTIRIALSQNYNSQTANHVWYVVALAIAFAGVFSRWGEAWDFFKASPKRFFAFLVILSLFLALVTYFSLRIFYWSFLGDNVLTIKEADLTNTNETTIYRVQGAVAAKFRGTANGISPNYFAQLFYDWGIGLSMIVLFSLWMGATSLGYTILRALGYNILNQQDTQKRSFLYQARNTKERFFLFWGVTIGALLGFFGSIYAAWFYDMYRTATWMPLVATLSFAFFLAVLLILTYWIVHWVREFVG
jgi:hypothetical protein